ncbi:MAG: hypothetical protein KA712_00300 [Myxococcales bacterium]|nr:hypothetical protein [Myxococcales bacterium]
MDVENKLVFAKASHFSMYMAAEGSLSVATSLGVMPAPPRCEGRLSAHSVLEATTAELPVAAINNLSDEMKALVPGALEMNAEGMPVKTVSLADLLATGQFRGTLRVVYVYELHEGDDDARVLLDRKVMTASLFVNEEGVARVTVVDALGNVIESRTYPALAGERG